MPTNTKANIFLEHFNEAIVIFPEWHSVNGQIVERRYLSESGHCISPCLGQTLKGAMHIKGCVMNELSTQVSWYESGIPGLFGRMPDVRGLD